MKLIDVFRIITLIAMFQFLFFSVFLFTKSNKNLSNKVLAFFLLTKSICLFGIITPWFNKTIFTHFPYLFFISGLTDFLFGPLIYFYVKSYLNSSFRFKKVHLLHATPFLLYFLYVYYYVFSKEMSVLQNLLLNNKVFPVVLENVTVLAVYIHVITYIVISLILFYKQNTKIVNYFSEPVHQKMNWMKIVLYGLLLISVSGFFSFVQFLIFDNYLTSLMMIREVMFFAFANIIVYKALCQPYLFNDFSDFITDKKYTLSVDKDLIEKVQSYMRTQKPYLEPDLTLDDLALGLGISAKKMSFIINQEFNMNFFNFINNYRIEEFKNNFVAAGDSKTTILETMYKVGFNSKSVFNSFFKKQTGMTPSEFKRLHQSTVVTVDNDD